MGALGYALDALCSAAAAVGGAPWGMGSATAEYALAHSIDARSLRRAMAMHADELSQDAMLLGRARISASAVLRGRVLMATSRIRGAQREHASRAQMLLQRARGGNGGVWVRLGGALGGAESASARAAALDAAAHALLMYVAAHDAAANAVRAVLRPISRAEVAELARALRIACTLAAALLRAVRGAATVSALAARVTDAVRTAIASMPDAGRVGSADAAAHLGRFLRQEAGGGGASSSSHGDARVAAADVRRTLEAIRDELVEGAQLCAHIEAAVAAGEPAALGAALRRGPVRYAEVTVGALAVFRAIAQRSRTLGGSGELEDGALAVSGAVCRFARRNVIKPATTLYKEIFHNELSTRTIVVQTVALGRKTLQTMLEDFTAANLSKVPGAMDAARVGDMAVVMRHYAHEARRPFGSLVFGDLAQALLLQVQKLKCDVEELIVKSRQTLQAQELNLALVALVPACGAVAVALYAASASLRRWRQRGTYLLVSPEQTLRFLAADVHAALVTMRAHGRSTDALLSLRCAGELALAIFELRTFVQSGVISAPPKVLHRFVNDLRTLEQSDVGVDARVLSLQRMWSVYPFLAHIPPSSLY